MLKQKSRERWIREGNTNSRYFHAGLQGRRPKNQIVSIHKNGNVLKGVKEIKGKNFNHFAESFSEHFMARPKLGVVNFKAMSKSENKSLIKQFSEEEVKEVIQSYEGDKSPGPDDFNLTFFKSVGTLSKKISWRLCRSFILLSIYRRLLLLHSWLSFLK